MTVNKKAADTKHSDSGQVWAEQVTGLCSPQHNDNPVRATEKQKEMDKARALL